MDYFAGIAQLSERDVSHVEVAGENPAPRSTLSDRRQQRAVELGRAADAMFARACLRLGLDPAAAIGAPLASLILGASRQ